MGVLENHWENTSIRANSSDNVYCTALGESEKVREMGWIACFRVPWLS